MRNAAPRVPKIPNLQFAQLLAPERVEQQCRQNGTVALLLYRFIAGRDEQLAGLVVAERRRLAFTTFGPGPLDAFDRVVGDGVFFAEIFEQRRQRREAMPDRGAAELASH
jgi:hypothetical protein